LTPERAYQRPSQRQLAAARKAVRRQQMDRAIAEGRLTVRAMTAEERTQSDARFAGAAKARGARPGSRRSR
jgi:hypothetical protein